jgi:PAS domain S-box-containing protein
MRKSRPWLDRPLRTKGLIVLAVPLLTFLLTVPFFLISHVQDGRAEDRLEHTLTVRTRIETARVLIFEAVARLRGYLLTGDTEFLALYERATASLPDAVSGLRALAAGPEQRDRVDRISGLSQELLGNLEQQRSAGGDPDAGPLALRSMHLTERIQAELDEMSATEDREVAAEHQAAEAADRLSLVVFGAMAPIGLGLTVAGMFLFTSGVSRRVRLVSDNAVRLADGRPFLPMPTGRDEVGKLAQALEETRNRLQEGEAAARDSRTKLRAVIDNTASAIFVKDLEQRFLLVNRAFEETFGIPQEDAVGKTVLELFPDDPAAPDWQQNDLEVLRRLESAQFEEAANTRNGRRVLLTTVAPILNESGRAYGLVEIATDITERKRHDEEQRRSAAKVADLYDNAPCGYHSLDREGRFTRINDTELRWLGYERDELLGRRVTEIQTEETRRRFEATFPTFKERGFIADLEMEFVRKDGSVLPVLLSSSAVTDDRGRYVSSRSTLVDITEYRRAQAELRASEARYRALARSFPNGSAAVFDRDLRYLVYDGSALEALGLRREDFEGKTVAEAPHTPEIARALERWYRAALEGERTVVETPRGDLTFVVQIGPVEDDTGAIVGGVQVAFDITERKRAEEELREVSTFLDSVIENIPNMVFVKDARDLRFVRFNHAGEELLGRTRDTLFGKNDYDFFPAEQADFFTAKDREVLQSGRLLDIPEEPIETPSGTRFLHTKKIPMRDGTGAPTHLLGISEDITERKRAEEEARLARAEAERANRAKSEFLSRMSHELRTPLNAVMGFAQLLEMDRLGEEQRDNVGQILKAGGHLLDLINEVLDIARIESGKLALSPEPVRIGDAVRDALDLIRPLADRNGVTIRTSSGLNGTYVLADRQRLKQVLLNLLSNAVKYNRRRGSVELSGEHDERTYRIHVSDTGPGIRLDEVERAFTPFDRLAAAGEVEGTGLGLPLSRGLVEAMGGSLGVTSTPGAGSTFTVELPLSESPVAAYDRAEAEAPSAEAAGAGTVVYVEDNLSNLRLVERVLRRRPGIRLITAMQARLGIDLALQHRADVVLLDLHLPDMDGLEALGAMRADERLRGVPVVIISADATRALAERAKAAGATAYLTKPLDVNRFLELVDDLLRARHDSP